MPTTSLTLLERVQNQTPVENGGVVRDADAWNRLVELYTPLLFRWSLKTGLNESQSEDLVQEVFKVLLTKIGAFERERDGSFRKWLQVVTVNKCKEQFRRKQLSITNADSSFDPLSAVSDPATLVEFWEDDYCQQVIQRSMQLMKAEFSEKVWRSCWEHIVQGRPASEVGEQLGITANAVRVYSSRILARLRIEFRDLL